MSFAPQAPRWQIQLGGLSKRALLEALAARQVQMNPMARELFENAAFPEGSARSVLNLMAVTVAELGFAAGATMPEVLAQAARLGLRPCPVETAPFFRLQYLDQPEGSVGQAQIKGQAPPGALTVVSEPLEASLDFPKGFYLRKADGCLWLRGYRSDDQHRWSASDGLVFVC
ncbi:hypothetical protein [Roseateles sp.]|uniref:hypothetical protein n=1 Tax=Roseateles sp. TaxID=1971397 RepID=UPI003BA5CDD4